MKPKQCFVAVALGLWNCTNGSCYQYDPSGRSISSIAKHDYNVDDTTDCREASKKKHSYSFYMSK